MMGFGILFILTLITLPVIVVVILVAKLGGHK